MQFPSVEKTNKSISMSEEEKKNFVISGELISINEAAKYTPYSAEYLSLRARTGHLKALKIARNWLTTKEAVRKYLRVQRQKHARSGSKKGVQS